jgi:hypothetical protein
MMSMSGKIGCEWFCVCHVFLCCFLHVCVVRLSANEMIDAHAYACIYTHTFVNAVLAFYYIFPYTTRFTHSLIRLSSQRHFKLRVQSEALASLPPSRLFSPQAMQTYDNEGVFMHYNENSHAVLTFQEEFYSLVFLLSLCYSFTCSIRCDCVTAAFRLRRRLRDANIRRWRRFTCI